MSIPVCCKACGQIIGVESPMLTLGRALFGDYDSDLDVGCTGEDHHPEPVRNETKRLFGLINCVRIEYPETGSASSWEEYVGPPIKVLALFAIVFGTKKYPNGSHKGLTINGKWAWGDFIRGCSGDGWGELEKMKRK